MHLVENLFLYKLAFTENVYISGLGGKIPINYVVWVSSKVGTKKLFFFLRFNPYPVLINTFLDSVCDALSNSLFEV